MNHNVRKSKQAERSSPWSIDPRLRAELGSRSPRGLDPHWGAELGSSPRGLDPRLQPKSCSPSFFAAALKWSMNVLKLVSSTLTCFALQGSRERGEHKWWVQINLRRGGCEEVGVRGTHQPFHDSATFGSLPLEPSNTCHGIFLPSTSYTTVLVFQKGHLVFSSSFL